LKHLIYLSVVQGEAMIRYIWKVPLQRQQALKLVFRCQAKFWTSA